MAKKTDTIERTQTTSIPGFTIIEEEQNPASPTEAVVNTTAADTATDPDAPTAEVEVIENNDSNQEAEREKFVSRGEIYYYVNENGTTVKKLLTQDIELQLIQTAQNVNLDGVERKQAMSLLLMAYDKYINSLVAKNYKYSTVSKEDLVQEAKRGFLSAILNFDAVKSNGARLMTFAKHHIQKFITGLITSISTATKVITSKDANSARTQILKIRSQRELTHEDRVKIAESLNNKTVSYVIGIENALTRPVSFDPVESNDDENSFNPAEYTVDQNSNVEDYVEETTTAREIRETFFKAFEEELDDREKFIIQHRVAIDFFDLEEKLKLHEIAEKFQISTERVRQIENNARKKLAERMEKFRPDNA